MQIIRDILIFSYKENIMKEVSKARNGNTEYVESVILKSGPRVFSEAILGKVIHNTPGLQDFILKIGRYKRYPKTPEITDPKSELTLDNEEFGKLITYLETNYGPLKLGEGKYLEVTQNETLPILKQIQKLNIPDEKQALELIESGLLTDNLQTAINTIKRKKAIEEFEDNLLMDKPESFWQDWFSKNKWVLGSEYLQIIDERHINVDNIADYLMEAFDGFVDIVEIKKPGIDKLWCDALDHGNYIPTSELTKAIIQCQNYIYEIERQSNSIDFLERVKNKKVIKPRCLLVFGRSNSWNNEQRKAYRILNASLTQITILTYDHLLERIKNIYGEEKAIDNFDDLPF